MACEGLWSVPQELLADAGSKLKQWHEVSPKTTMRVADFRCKAAIALQMPKSGIAVTALVGDRKSVV